jgi:hypothetical protein
MDVIRREAKRVAGRTVEVNLYGNQNWKKIPVQSRKTEELLTRPVKASAKSRTPTQ